MCGEVWDDEGREAKRTEREQEMKGRGRWGRVHMNTVIAGCLYTSISL